VRYLRRIPLVRRRGSSRRRRGTRSMRRRRGRRPYPPSGSETLQDSWSDRYLWIDGRLFGQMGKGK